ncbi:NAD-dependent epimerase/dehydratase family protein [Vibrio parahaemolyticus]|uniref:NAD-dependent epimerase/dehydratase family protein n=1 Tax=Vibrio parahaemolyticus TaxID=670 RepID=UPI001E4D9BA3|nr:NAD-dependent epimerase/dehydratase family protein [Vibrio parahaemolyticus]EKP4404098.1 NAD-dependent epimerase/dehydratase family protein [Vibrio parahaemolyticus]
MSNNIAVTGYSGFIGSNISSRFLGINLRHDSDFEKLKNCDVVIHLAGLAHRKYSEEELFNVNLDLTKKLVDKAILHNVKRFVYLSSINVLNESDNQTSTRSKRAAVEYLREVSTLNKLEVVIVFAPLVYGPNAPGNFGLLTRLISNVRFLPFGSVYNQRNFISVQNLADLLQVCAINPDAAGHEFIASEGESVSTKEFTNAIAKGLGKKVYQIPVPVPLMRVVGKLFRKTSMVELLVGNLQLDSSDLKNVLNWTPPYSMEQSMIYLRPKN